MKHIPVIFNIDKKIVMPTAITISSILRHLDKTCFLDVNILYFADDLPLEERNKLCLWFKCHDRVSFKFIDIKNLIKEFENIKQSLFEIRDITSTTYLRLFSPFLLNEYNKAIYIDADIVIRTDLSTLIDYPMENNLVAGVKDSSTYYEKGRVRIKEIGANPTTYINSGLTLYNLSKLRNSPDYERRVKDLIQVSFMNQDQDIINIICKDHILNLPHKYNLTNSIYSLYHEGIIDIDRQEIEEAELIGNIHFTGSKPWKTSCYNEDIWWEEYRHSPCYNSNYYYEQKKECQGIDSLSIRSTYRHLTKKIFNRIQNCLVTK